MRGAVGVLGVVGQSSGPTPIALVQQTYAGNATTVTPGSSVSTSNTLVLVVTTFSGGDTVTSVSGGGTWTKATGFASISGGGNGSGEIWYCLAPTAGINTVTVAFTSSPSWPSLTLSEWSGVIVGLDSTAVYNPGTSQDTYTGPVVTPTHANCLFVSVSGFQALSAQTNWTAFSSWSSGSNAYNWSAYIVGTGTTAQAPTGNAHGSCPAVAVAAFYA